MEHAPESDVVCRLGFGTGNLRDHDTCVETVIKALEAGYRHIDTARAYQNERAIGEAIKQSEISRDSVFIATKVHSEQLGYEDCIESVNASRDAIDVETIDLVYIHWPAHTYDPSETIAALKSLQSSGAIRHIGLSNFTVELIREIRKTTNTSIFAIQAEMHPYLQQNKLYEYVRRHEIKLFAHTPLCQGDVLTNPVLSSIADTHGVSEAQVALAWLFSKERVGAVTGARPVHMHENLAALSMTLTPEEVQQIESIETEKRCVDYEFAPWNSTTHTKQ